MREGKRQRDRMRQSETEIVYGDASNRGDREKGRVKNTTSEKEERERERVRGE